MADILGTNVSARVVPFTTDDQYATHVSTYGQGGWHEVATIQERNAIPADRRIAGMAVLITSESKLYTLNADLTTWSEFESGSVDDVLVNGSSVVENKIAEITVPTNNNQLTNGAGYQTASDVETAIANHNVDAEAHADIRAEISALNDFTASTIVPTTTNFVPSTTYTIDEALQRTANLFGGIQGEIDDINGLIPNQATTSNQLADKAFVNSTVATNSANFRGNWATWADVPTSVNDYPADYTGSKTPTNNDYMTVTDASGYNVENTGSWRFIYVGDWTTNGKNGWQPQYQIGTAFTAAQQAAIDSGITSNMVDNYVNPTSSASTAYNARITALETDKVDKYYSANKIYGTDSTGAQIAYQTGSNLELRNGLINVIGVQQQLFVMPEATAELLGSIVQYMGTDTADYTHGVMYQCVPVYGDYTITTVDISDVTLDRERFEQSFLYDPNILSYTFECTRAGLRQTWLLPNGQSWTGGLMQFGIDYMGRPTLGATITLTRAVAGYTWDAYAGVSAGNDKIKVVGDKIYGINVVGQYNERTIPMARAELAGTIIQYNGLQSLLSVYQDGHFYRCEEDRRMRDYTLEADPMKYSELVISDWITLEDFMAMYSAPVSFIWQGDGRGWVEEESMSILGTDDLTQYGIDYTLDSGETLEVGDKITINFTSSYFWKLISVQDGLEVVQLLPEASEEYLDKIVLYDGWDSSLPEPDALNVQGKLYKCVEIYNEQTEEWGYEWQALPYQFGLLQYTELPSDTSKVYTDQCIQYVGASQLWDIYAEDVYLENGHIYRATIVDEDYPDFAEVRYVDTHPYQMMYMPDPIEAYDGVITQYVGESGDYINGHFYKCVPTGGMTGPSSKYKIDGNFDVTINAETLATQTTDPNQTQVFEFQSQGEGYDWVLKVDDTTWTTVDIANYGITVLGSVPYGTQLKVKYQEPQPEYEWWDVQVADYVEQFYYMPDPTDDYTKEYMGRTVQYIGYEEDYTHNYFYQCMATSDPVSEGSVTMTVTDDEKFSEVIKRLSTGAIIYSVKFHQEGSIYNPYWVLDALDSDGNVIGGQSFTNDATTFEDETGIKIEGTVDDLTEIIADIEVYWKNVSVQDGGQLNSMPDVNMANIGHIAQYTGETNEDYINGYFYKAFMGIEQTSGDAVMTVTNQEKFAERLSTFYEESGNIVIQVGFRTDYGGDPLWQLVYYDENGNELGSFSSNAEAEQFEKDTGILITGLINEYTYLEADVISGWNRIDVQANNVLMEIPPVTGEYIDNVYQYLGETSNEFVKGYFYTAYIWYDQITSGNIVMTIGNTATFLSIINTAEMSSGGIVSKIEFSVDMSSGEAVWKLNLYDENENLLYELPSVADQYEFFDLTGLWVEGNVDEYTQLEADFEKGWKRADVQPNMQVEEMPVFNGNYLGQMVQYIGDTNRLYTSGYFYKGTVTVDKVSDGNATMTVSNQKTFGNWVFVVQMLEGTTVHAVAVSEDGGQPDYWILSFYDSNNIEILSQSFDSSEFESKTGLLVEGTVDSNTHLETPVFSGWRRFDVQPNDQVKEFPILKDSDIGTVVQYLGEDTEDYTNGYFYEYVGDIYGVGDLSCTSNDGGFEESVELDVEQFEDYVQPEGSYNQSFTYVEADDSWCLTDNPEEFVNIADYGVSYPAPPTDGIWLELHYTRGIPLSFRWKQLNTQPTIQRTEFITESEDLKEGDIVQYVGDDTEDYTHGYFYQAIETSISETSLTYKYIGTSIESITIDKSSFESMVQPTKDMVLTFHYVATDYAWYDENSEEIDPANYGISIVGQPQDGDILKLIYKVGRPVYDWQQVNTQPLPLASEFPNYDVTKKQMLVHNIDSDVIEWEDIV